MEAMKLTPIKATKEMIADGVLAYDLTGIASGIINLAEDHVEFIYNAMLAAAPEGAGEAATVDKADAWDAVAAKNARIQELVAEVERLTREQNDLRRAIAGKPGLDHLAHGQYREMAQTLHAACDGGRSRAEAAEVQASSLKQQLDEATGHVVKLLAEWAPISKEQVRRDAQAFVARRALEATTPTNGESHGS